MFHIIYKLSKSIIIPILFVTVIAIIKKRRGQDYKLIDLCCKWFCFWVIGFGGVSVGLMQTFNPMYTANLLNVQVSDMIVIRELGLAQIGIGLVGLLSIRFDSFRVPSSISYGIFILGAVVLHTLRIEHINFEEIVSLVDDAWTVVVALFVIVHMKTRLFATQNSIEST